MQSTMREPNGPNPIVKKKTHRTTYRIQTATKFMIRPLSHSPHTIAECSARLVSSSEEFPTLLWSWPFSVAVP